MQKVVTINLNGNAYQLDETAFAALYTHLVQPGLVTLETLLEATPKERRTLLFSATFSAHRSRLVALGRRTTCRTRWASTGTRPRTTAP